MSPTSESIVVSPLTDCRQNLLAPRRRAPTDFVIRLWCGPLDSLVYLALSVTS